MINFKCHVCTGTCTCSAGFSGKYCEEQCEEGMFGQSCKHTCDCVQDQTATCFSVTGKCVCKPPFQGEAQSVIISFKLMVCIDNFCLNELLKHCFIMNWL